MLLLLTRLLAVGEKCEEFRRDKVVIWERKRNSGKESKDMIAKRVKT